MTFFPTIRNNRINSGWMLGFFLCAYVLSVFTDMRYEDSLMCWAFCQQRVY